jgi:hypothetical protein
MPVPLELEPLELPELELCPLLEEELDELLLVAPDEEELVLGLPPVAPDDEALAGTLVDVLPPPPDGVDGAPHATADKVSAPLR